MYSSRCNCSNENNSNSCNRNGERILVNQGCGCNNARRRCACQNTFRPGCGNNHCGCNQKPDCGNSSNYGCHSNQCNCGNHSNCGCGNEHCGCRPKPCPPRPCPPKRPTCEDRCRAQYRQCLRNCRYEEEENNRCDACDYDFDYDE